MGCCTSKDDEIEANAAPPAPAVADDLPDAIREKLNKGFSNSALAGSCPAAVKGVIGALRSKVSWAQLVEELKRGHSSLSSDDAAGNALVEYGRYIALKVANEDWDLTGDTALAPSKAVDDVWRTHAKMGKVYSDFCTAVVAAGNVSSAPRFGTFENTPAPSTSEAQHKATATAYAAAFTKKYAALLWPDEKQQLLPSGGTGNSGAQSPASAVSAAPAAPAAPAVPVVRGTEEESNMTRIFVKTLTGKTMDFNVPLDSNVAFLKETIHLREDIPLQNVRLIFAGRQLEDAQTISSCNIQAESTIHLVGRPGQRASPSSPTK